MKEHIKPIRTEDKKTSSNWKELVVFLVLPVLCILLVSDLPGYLYVRLSLHMPIIARMLYPALVILMIICFYASIVRLIVAWKTCTWAKRILIITEIFLIVFAISLMMPLLRLVELPLWSDAGGLCGIRDRVRNQVDIPAIQNWLKTLDKEDYTPRRNYLSADELPEPLKWMSFGSVHLSVDENGNPFVDISAGGGFHHWGATIGMEDMVISESDLNSRYHSWLLVEPGFYVGEW